MPFFTASEVFGSGDLVEDVESAAGQTKAVVGGVSDIPTEDPWGRSLFATPDVSGAVDEGLQNVQENVDPGGFLGKGRAVPTYLEDLPFTSGKTSLGPDLTDDGGNGNGGSDFPWMLLLLVAGLFALGTVVDIQHSTGGGESGT